MNILGISCFYHDAAAALAIDGVPVAGAQEERFTGCKHDADFPIHAINFCLEKGGLKIEDIDAVFFYDKPFLKFDRILNGYLQTVPLSYPAFRLAIPVWLREKLWTPHVIKSKLHYHGDIYFIEHHLSHAAGSYYTSPFDRAAILTVDGVGEWATASIGKASGTDIKIIKTMNYPHSVGLLYSAFTYFLGFTVNSSEYKVMGLSPYGQPLYADLIEREIVKVFADGSIHLDLKYLKFHHGLTMTSKRLERLLGRPRCESGQELTQSDKDIAASIQAVTEKIIFSMACHTREITGENNLCMAGGVALNCAATGKLLKSGLFEQIHVQPASSDSGGAVGAALYGHYALTGQNKKIKIPASPPGPLYKSADISNFLGENKIPHTKHPLPELAGLVAQRLAEGKIVGLFQGPMEFGPRALGFRSILADPRDSDMKARLNEAVKFREPFRPFAPVVTQDRAGEYFDCDGPSPYMLFNFIVREDKRSRIPAVTHIDGTARIQTVNERENPFLYDILNEFDRLTGVPVLLNTSLNLRGWPIVRTPRAAFATFISSGLDILIMEDCLLDKSVIIPADFPSYKIMSRTD